MIDHDFCTLDAIVEAYKQNQRRVRGLREPTLKSYEQVLRLFLRVSLGEDPLDLTRLAPADVVRFVTSLQDRYAASSIKHVRTALRSLFRFLRMQGYCDEKLELAIPAVAHWRMANLPRCLNEQQLKQVLEAFDLRTPCGLRDRAMALCLSTLGLRPRELAELRLEDIDWRAGTLRLRTRKTRRGAMLPLPREAGHALVTYLRQGRGKTTERRVFVQHSGRHCGTALSALAITAAVVRAFRRAGVDTPLGGAYVFRHTVASRLVARGASLKEVADFLGHQCLDTTTIYAKLDLGALREVALPWPEASP
jgi:integrase/recombinase XerD